MTRFGGPVWLAAVLLIAACGDDGDGRRVATATPVAVVTPTSVATSSAAATSTMAVPTQTPPPAATPTATDVPLPPTSLRGKVVDQAAQPLSGVMVTAYDDALAYSVTVFTGADGSYQFPDVASATYRLRARRVGWEESHVDPFLLSDDGAEVDFTLGPTSDLNGQLPPVYFKSLLTWPSQRVAGDFSRACANCHQIGDFRWRKPRTHDEWKIVVDRMIGYGGIPFFEETREVLLDTIASTFSPDGPAPQFDVPPPPSGEVLRAVIHEWEIDPEGRPGCHDLELARDGTVYTVGGIWSLDPATGERTRFPLPGGGHSIERAADGDMWITAPGPEQMIKFDVETKEFTRFDQPRIGEDLGSYPHTLRFDDNQDIWYTLSRSNHVCRFDPETAEFTYYRLPPADAAVSGVPVPVAYGCDVAPNQTVWWSQLFGHKIGRVDPTTGEVSAWQPPFDGPRRLRVGPDNIVWVPGYGSGELGRFDPETETWTVYNLPGPVGQELPYATAVNQVTGNVWITGSNSDSMIRFNPQTEQFLVVPLPTATDFTREIEFGDDNSVWTCTSNQEIAPDRPGSGRILKIEIRPRVGECGDGIVQLGEACDDDNTVDCDGCSAECEVESGCGDGVRCDPEECDDGNAADCDGCSTCIVEIGSECGDEIVNMSCGEECDPPEGELCTARCQRVPVCGDGFIDDEEECDDGNTADCDGCSGACGIESGCGDGVRCGAEECDDGNAVACDGCAECVAEIGASCGDGIVREVCGEQCDPPGDGCSVICTSGDGILGTRTMTFGGEFFSSSLGVEVPLGTLEGSIDLVGSNLDSDGVAPLEVLGPVYYSAAILGGQFGTLCVRIDSCSGFVDCDGGSPVDSLIVQDSNGAGLNGLPPTVTTGLGDDGGSGAVSLECQQTFVQLEPGAGEDCLVANYPPAERIVYTTGTSEGFFINGNPKVGNGAIEASGDPFDCSSWGATDGPGRLIGTYLVEEDPRAGDVANFNELDD